MNKPHIYNFGLIGNCSYLAHIDTSANVVWMCWPQFDSDFVFGSLLDKSKGGEFSVRPAEANYRSWQYYLPNTNILCTEFESDSGSFRVIDFSPRFIQFERAFHPSILMRKIEPLSGCPKVKVHCQPRHSHGSTPMRAYDRSNHLRYDGREERVRLYSDIPMTFLKNEQEFALTKDQSLILSWGMRIEEDIPSLVGSYFDKTKNYWQKWVADHYLGNFHQEAMIRSALVLKIHQYEDTGAIIASGTTSLPESPGSGRNWDYRYCWIRDSHYTLSALSSLGSFSELQKYDEYIQNLAHSENKRYQPLYSISGQSQLTETILDLEGYLGNQPVRVGNQAFEHIQNDAYGQLIVSFLPLYADARFLPRASRNDPRLIKDLLTNISEIMDEPDAGLWEFRNLQQHHAYTYLFHWAGAKAAGKIGKVYQDEDILKLSNDVQSRASKWLEKCYDKERGVYTQAAESKNLDSCLLQLITMHYLHPNSSTARQHLRVLEEELKTPEGLLYRYRHKDDFGHPETTFLVCSFWYVEALACVGRIEEAIEAFEKLLSYGNHVGLLPEDISSGDGSQWGNFPQTYSHVGLLNAAFRISHRLDQPFYM